VYLFQNKYSRAREGVIKTSKMIGVGSGLDPEIKRGEQPNQSDLISLS
jgi:hypothetical protein